MAHAQYSLLDEEIEALVKGGYYPSKKDLIRDAIKTPMNVKADLRISAAVEIYKQGNISPGRGAEISGVSNMEFKRIISRIFFFYCKHKCIPLLKSRVLVEFQIKGTHKFNKK